MSQKGPQQVIRLKLSRHLEYSSFLSAIHITHQCALGYHGHVLLCDLLASVSDKEASPVGICTVWLFNLLSQFISTQLYFWHAINSPRRCQTIAQQHAGAASCLRHQPVDSLLEGPMHTSGTCKQLPAAELALSAWWLRVFVQPEGGP